MFTKTWSFMLLIACNVAIHTSDNPYQLAKKLYSIQEAHGDLIKAGYFPCMQDLALKGDLKSGANFVDGIIPVLNQGTKQFENIRVVCYGPGRYVKTHSHLKTKSHSGNEFFVVTRGGCKVWTLLALANGKSRWKSAIKTQNDTISIPEGTVHCLIAGPEGLCMHVNCDDSTRNVTFVDMQQPWEPDLSSYDIDSLYS